MGYFRELPDFEFQSPFSTYRNSKDEYIKTKNLFKRMKLIDEVYNDVTNFDRYIIPDGVRPDQVALEYYKDEELDYVILITNNIINLRDEWPLGGEDFYNFIYRKYGKSNIQNIHHYETTELKDTNDKLVVPAGKLVDSNFTIYLNGVSVNPVKSVSNLAYEFEENNKKTEIYLLKPQFLGLFINDLRTAYKYTVSSQRRNAKTKRGSY